MEAISKNAYNAVMECARRAENVSTWLETVLKKESYEDMKDTLTFICYCCDILKTSVNYAIGVLNYIGKTEAKEKKKAEGATPEAKGAKKK